MDIVLVIIFCNFAVYTGLYLLLLKKLLSLKHKLQSPSWSWKMTAFTLGFLGLLRSVGDLIYRVWVNDPVIKIQLLGSTAEIMFRIIAPLLLGDVILICFLVGYSILDSDINRVQENIKSFHMRD